MDRVSVGRRIVTKTIRRVVVLRKWIYKTLLKHSEVRSDQYVVQSSIVTTATGY
ncbi:unnamed protein product [Anisakis simplex]|uniref:Uncharacterized protein n=1 Tax=Anisakis simplex TaxID=6269 RepID=A0A3P6NT47_ANISI|nr:unnamed protein product [Anisakis simplex]